MRLFATLLILPLTLLSVISGAAMANGKKGPPAAITFHLQGTAAESPKFSREVETLAGKHFFRKVPEISTKDIVAFAPFPADDNATYGIVFQLSKRSAQRINATTNLNRGKLLMATVNGQAIGVVRINAPVTDGKLVIWSGIKADEIKLYDQLAPRIGEDPKIWKKRLKYESKK